MSIILQELQAFASFDLHPNQKQYFAELLKIAKPVQCVRAADVFNPDDLAYIRDWLKPEMKQCYKNSHLLCEAFPDMVTYCEGKVYSLFPIDHAFNRVGDKYIDITFEFALNDTELTEYEYMVFGDYELEEIERISDETGYYGNYYQYLYREKMRNPRTP